MLHIFNEEHTKPLGQLTQSYSKSFMPWNVVFSTLKMKFGYVWLPLYMLQSCGCHSGSLSEIDCPVVC